MANPVDVVLIGAGNRGAESYAPYALDHPEEVRFVAVAEPNAVRRERFAQEHNIPQEKCFASWEALIAQGQLGVGAIVATPDNMHVEPALAALKAGYHVLLEKPIAPTLDACVVLIQTAEQHQRILQICHVLRYTDFFTRLHEIIKSGRLGDIITVEQRENAAYYHMAHSFVRGNWRNSDLSSPMILAKCCHDLDVLVWNMGEPCEQLSSVGSLKHFRAESVPDDIPDRCTDGCPIEQECPFSAISIYLDAKPLPAAAEYMQAHDGDAPRTWPFTVISDEMSREARLHALQTGPYGRCVYRCDNNVVDHQLVTMQFEGGASVLLAMHGHSDEEHRSMRYDGTKATLHGHFSERGSWITIHDHLTDEVERITFDEEGSGHGGGDAGIMASFVQALNGDALPMTDARTSLESHLLAFAAEEARLGKKVVDMADYRTQAG